MLRANIVRQMKLLGFEADHHDHMPAGAYNGQAIWCRIGGAVNQLANMTPPAALH